MVRLSELVSASPSSFLLISCTPTQECAAWACKMECLPRDLRGSAPGDCTAESAPCQVGRRYRFSRSHISRAHMGRRQDCPQIVPPLRSWLPGCCMNSREVQAEKAVRSRLLGLRSLLQDKDRHTGTVLRRRHCHVTLPRMSSSPPNCPR